MFWGSLWQFYDFPELCFFFQLLFEIYHPETQSCLHAYDSGFIYSAKYHNQGRFFHPFTREHEF